MKKPTTINHILDNIYDDLKFPCFTWYATHAIGVALCALEDEFSKRGEHTLAGYCNYLIRFQGGEKTQKEVDEYRDMEHSVVLIDPLIRRLVIEFEQSNNYGLKGRIAIAIKVIQDRMKG